MSPDHWNAWTNEQWIMGLRRSDAAVETALIGFMQTQANLLARRRRLDDPEAAAQEATIAAYRKVTERLSQFRDQGPFLGWVRRIVQHAVSDEGRKIERSPYRERRLAMAGDDTTTPGITVADPAAEADFAALEADPTAAVGLPPERLAALRRCLEQLLPLEQASLRAWADIYPLLMAAEHYYRLRWEQEQALARREERDPDERYKLPKKIDLPERRERYAAVAAQFEVPTEFVHTYAKNARTKMQRCLGA